MAFARGHEAMGRVLDALGLRGQAVNKLVIVCEVNAPVVVYVKRLAHEEEMDAIADNLIEPAPQEVQVATVNGLEVDERGRVFVPAGEVARLRGALERITALSPFGSNAEAMAVARGALEREGGQ